MQWYERSKAGYSDKRMSDWGLSRGRRGKSRERPLKDNKTVFPPMLVT